MSDKKYLHRIFYSKSTDPYFNLSVEDYLLRNLKIDERILFLYKNSSCVVMGRFQNPWIECLLHQLEIDSVNLVRRQSGGGTVFHDLGNLNFSFIDPQLRIEKEKHNKVILDALIQLGIKAYPTGRSDLMLEHLGHEYKFSGSAFKQTKNRSLHHGTLLLDSDLDQLGLYLSSKKREIKTKATQSVRKKVMNLKEKNSSLTEASLLKAFVQSYNQNYCANIEMTYIDIDDFLENHSVKDYYQFLTNDQWKYFETPKFEESFHYEISGFEIHIELIVKKGVIIEASVFGNLFHLDIFEDFKDCLIGQKYLRSSLIALEKQMKEKYAMYDEEFSTLFEKLLDHIW